MGLALSPQHIRRYRDLARLLIRYGRDESVRPKALRNGRAPARRSGKAAAPEAERAEALAHDLEAMGPTFVKLGQILSTHVDLPPAYARALSRLRDDCKPVPFAILRPIVEEELGTSISKAFASFDETPLASASLGQVHRAVLPSGREVVVKVQRPDIHGQISEDFQALDRIAGLLDRHTEAGRRYEFRRILQEGRQVMLNELDYRAEAHHLARLGEDLREFTRIVVPQPVEDYTTTRVLTMDYVAGRSVGSLDKLDQLELNGPELADELFRAYLHQTLVTGLVHADPHPGNIFLTEDNRLAILDLGQVIHIDASTRQELTEIMLAVSDGRGDDAAAVAMRIGQHRPNFNPREFRSRISRIVSEHADRRLDAIGFGDSMLAIGRACAESGLRVPPEVNIIGKVCGNLGAVARVLDPHMTPNRTIQRHLSSLILKQATQALSPSNLLSNALEVRRFVQRMPERVNRVVDMLADNQLRLRLDVINEQRLMGGFQKIANRITVGLLLASMIVSAALLMRVPSDSTLLGYPALPILLLLFAAVGSIGLIFTILLYDDRQPPPPPTTPE